MKKSPFTIFILLLLVVSLPLSAFAEEVEYSLGLMSIYASGSTVSYFDIYDSVQSISGFNVMNAVLTSDTSYDHYATATISADSTDMELTIAFMGQGFDSETYVNTLTVDCSIPVPSDVSLAEMEDPTFFEVEWEGVTINPSLHNYTTTVRILSTYTNRFYYVVDGTQYNLSYSINRVRFTLYLDDYVNVGTSSTSILVHVPLYSPWDFDEQALTPSGDIRWQIACNDVKLTTTTIDDIVAEIGSQLQDVNNNLVILQGISNEILEELKNSEYADEVQALIDKNAENVSRAEDQAQLEQSMWDSISLPHISPNEGTNDVIWNEFDFIWNEWVIVAILTVGSIALLSYVLYGGT